MSIKDSKILIVEDETHINRLIELVLQSDGYFNIEKTFDGKEALEKIEQNPPDLILLDVMIPNIDGFELAKIIKNNPCLKNIQIIMLTAKKMEEDILNGFKNGAIDYITKPFSNKILLARIKAHLENAPQISEKRFKNISLNDSNYTVKTNDETIDLTPFEFKLLKLFLSNIDRVFSRGQLLEYLRGNDGFEVSERAIDVQILNLRRKLKNFGKNIKTIRGFGYKLEGNTNE